MDNPIILVTFIMVVMTGIAIIAVIVVLKKRRAELARLEAGVGSGNIPDSEPAGFPRKGAGEHEGVAFSYHYHPGSKNSPSSYTVQVAHPSPVTFKISKESGFDRFAEKLGLNVELKTGDPVFDETFYITSTDTDYMRMVLDSSTNRRLVSEIHEIGFTSIILTRKELKAV